jgi:hypothetical protein
MTRPKAWIRYRSYGGRRTGSRKIRQRFLIVCEGEKTEPNYFRAFRVPGDVVIDIRSGAGAHTSVVREAIHTLENTVDTYDQIWCVFDRDKNTAKSSDTQNFNEALRVVIKKMTLTCSRS